MRFEGLLRVHDGATCRWGPLTSSLPASSLAGLQHGADTGGPWVLGPRQGEDTLLFLVGGGVSSVEGVCGDDRVVRPSCRHGVTLTGFQVPTVLGSL